MKPVHQGRLKKSYDDKGRKREEAASARARKEGASEGRSARLKAVHRDPIARSCRRVSHKSKKIFDGKVDCTYKFAPRDIYVLPVYAQMKNDITSLIIHRDPL